MKRWLPLFALVSLLFMWAAGCGGDDLFGNATIGGDASADAQSGGDATTGRDGSVTDGSIVDSGGDANPSDSGEDSAIDSGEDAGFDSGPADAGPTFNVMSATSTGLTTVTVSFDATPDMTEAQTAGNYAITAGASTLNVTAAALSGTTVTLTTATQSAVTYTVTVTGVTRDPDGRALTNNTAMFTGIGAFDVSTAMATTNTTVNVTFDAPADPTTGGDFTNYAIADGASTPLAVSAASLSGDGLTATLTTAPQTGGTTYTVTVSNVTRASDTQPLSNNQASFTGRSSFNVTGAASNSSTQVTVTFDGPPNGAGNTAGNFTIVDGSSTSLAVSTASVSGNTVILTTAPQSATSYTVTVSSNVLRSGDSEPLATNGAGFTGIAPFNVTAALALNSTTVTITFDAVPNGQAVIPANYAIVDGSNNPLAVSAATPSGAETITLTTDPQAATSYTVTVSNVRRTGDNEPLLTNQAPFTGTTTPASAPTVTNVVVTGTSPDNGTIPYNTGTSTVTITGTSFAGVTCASGTIVLDDLDGAGTAVGTPANSAGCSVDSDTQITATFPAGIRTNGGTGWNVIVNNRGLQNTTSSVPFVPVAGLLISEVLDSNGTGKTTHEFVEIYNPTATSFKTKPASTVLLHMHVRGSGATPADTDKTLGLINGSTGEIPSHGYLLIISSASVSPEQWFTNGDYSYSASSNSLVDDGGVYISLSGTAQT
ncbi:MAG: beta strand repeat-containing protein, partial [Polyangiaceae bacterium]